MPAVSNLFDFLSEEDNLAVDSALLAALSGADEGTAYRIVRTLLKRKKRNGLRGLVAHYHELPAAIQTRLTRQSKALSGALREASQDKSPQTLSNLIDIIRDGSLYRSAYLLDLALRHRESRVREKAALALHRLCEEVHASSPILAGDAPGRDPEDVEKGLAEQMCRVREAFEDRP